MDNNSRLHYLQILFLMVAVFLSAAVCVASGPKDERYRPITPAELVLALKRPSADRDARSVLLAQAYNSGLIGQAYEYYASLARVEPKDADIQLLYGYTAMSFESYLVGKEHRLGPGTKQERDLLLQTSKALADALKLAPDSPYAEEELGYFDYSLGNYIYD